jgi:mannose/fructose-specific phosphotransferase system component IIA
MTSDHAVAIVIGHGDVASGLVSAVQLITGRGDRLVPLSNRGLGTAEIEELLREQVEATGARVIFTDLPAGSCNFAACNLLRWRDDLVVVTGVNLPALLTFATQGELPPGEAAAQAASRGSAALRTFTGTLRAN